jgi:uncharacterized membrane protein YeaQ/YmgE (transglycosylase-associated protein family)
LEPLLGGPIGGAAMTMLSQALGCENNERALQRAIQSATPEQLAEIKKAELDFEARMKELDVDIFALETQDAQDARKHFAKDWTAKLIALVMVGFFCSYIAMITVMPPEQNSMELINLVLGYMGGLVSAVISYYFGASKKQE